MASSTREKTLVLFDVDGTLTRPRLSMDESMRRLLQDKLRPKALVGLVSGSDLAKLQEQVGEDILDRFDFVFPENGLVAYEDGKLIAREDIASHVGEDRIQDLVNFALRYMSDLRLPIKRGNFVEFRNGLVNFCPVGRSCSQVQRLEFSELDKREHIREKFVCKLREKFGHLGLVFAIGGQISIDAYPVGWDKRHCLKHLETRGFREIHFYGDRTEPGGNDHDIFGDDRVLGHTVLDPEDTMKRLCEQFDI